MKTIVTEKNPKSGDELVVYSPSSVKGEEARIFNHGKLVATAVCAGGIKPLYTQSRGDKKADAYRNYRRFIVS